MTPYLIPTTPQAQRFSISLLGVVYQMTLHWCAPSTCWVLDLADQSGVALVSGLPLVTGADLLSQLGYLGVGGALVVQTDGGTDNVPTFENLGTNGNVFFLSP